MHLRLKVETRAFDVSSIARRQQPLRYTGLAQWWRRAQKPGTPMKAVWEQTILARPQTTVPEIAIEPLSHPLAHIQAQANALRRTCLSRLDSCSVWCQSSAHESPCRWLVSSGH